MDDKLTELRERGDQLAVLEAELAGLVERSTTINPANGIPDDIGDLLPANESRVAMLDGGAVVIPPARPRHVGFDGPARFAADLHGTYLPHWPPAGSYMATNGQDLMAADSLRAAREEPVHRPSILAASRLRQRVWSGFDVVAVARRDRIRRSAGHASTSASTGTSRNASAMTIVVERTDHRNELGDQIDRRQQPPPANATTALTRRGTRRSRRNRRAVVTHAGRTVTCPGGSRRASAIITAHVERTTITATSTQPIHIHHRP
ncbi:MAG: hypothetical protein AB7W59_01255 [Acidimicrobiia bacterium]